MFDYEVENHKRQFNFLHNQVINGILVWFLVLLGLLYHSAVGVKGILQVQYYWLPMQLINKALFCV